jgi:hypothetical protein
MFATHPGNEPRCFASLNMTMQAGAKKTGREINSPPGLNLGL